MNNSYIYIYHVNVTQTVPDISPLMPMHQDPLLVWNLIKYKVDLIIWNRYVIFKMAAVSQHDLSYALYEHMNISVDTGNRNGVLVNMVHEYGLQHFLWHITGSICIPVVSVRP